MMMRLLLSFILTGSTLLLADTLRIEDLVRHGLQHAPKLKTLELKLKNTEEDITIAKSMFYPSVNFDSKHGYATPDPWLKTRTDGHLSQFSLSLSYPILNNFLDQNHLDQARAHKEYASEVRAEQISQFILDIHEAIFDLSLKRRLLTHAQIKYDLLTEQFATIEQSYKSGFKPQTDFLRIKSQFQKSQIDIENLKFNIEVLLTNISVLAGLDPKHSFDVEEIQPDYKKYPQITIPKIDVEQHYITRINKYSVDVEQFNVNLARRERSPNFFLNLESNYGAYDYWGPNHPSLEDSTRQQTTAYIGIRYNIFDAGKLASQFEKSVNQRLIATENSTQAVREVKMQLYNLERSIQVHLKTAKLNLELFNLEQENFNLLKRSYQRGQVNVLELILALESFEAAQNNYVQSYYHLLIDKARLWHHQRKFNSTTTRLEF